ncbi:MAG: hypothetical protein GTO45_08015 [Candidatus Aminicenantes bacterium]|nr:hypothetical protein [Candidatus Aminicenantes bacterium]NIM78776.1 hypothetical protein [Candidatus Aminicenantes bacterium]NIN18031.1 hypothetical protein [Candidatus Aminicenantes bacterium]NIN41931.1 hypothetical protein [Candidatus Aminicenantes bacterium]NIN84686.1 hypothetical protein [Candidatus Aminicenantes bacterium]
MEFDDQFSQHYDEMLEGTYECADRIVINGYDKVLHHPGGFRWWWRELKGSDDDLDTNHLMRMASRFARRAKAFANHSNIEMIYCKPNEKKYEIAAEHIPEDKNFCGVFLILVSRASAFTWKVERSAGGKIRNIEAPNPYVFVNHYWFHIMDKEWGHVIVKISSHPPFDVQVILNGHEWVERKALKKKIKIKKEKNCFTYASDIKKLCKLADTIYEKGHLQSVCDRWVYYFLWFGLNQEEQKKSGFRYKFYIYQGELSRNFIFKRGRHLDEVYQNIIDLSRRHLDVKSLNTIFGWKHRPYNRKHKEKSFQVRIEKPLYNLTVLKLFDGIMIVKIYDKGERVLRIEVTCNNARHIKGKHGVENFSVMMEKFRQILESFIKALQLSHTSFIDNGEFDQLCLPSKKGAQRLAGIDLNKARCRNAMKAVLELSTKSGGFSSKDLANKYVQITQIPEQNYKSRHAAYDLRKLRAKQIVQKKENSRKYQVTTRGIAVIVASIVFREKIFKPISTGINKKEIAQAPQKLAKIDQIYLSIREKIMDICKCYGVEVKLCKTC